MDDTVLLNTPAIDPDIHDVLCAPETPNTCPSSTLGLTLPHTNVLPTNPNTNTSNNLTSTVPSVSPTDVNNIVFRNPTASHSPFVFPLTVPNAPSTVPDGPSTRETTVEELDQLPDLPPADAYSFLLSFLKMYRNHEWQLEQLYDVNFLKTQFKGGIQEVQGLKDPLSNMWTGPVYFQNQRWPTREHAIVAVKLGKASHLDSEEICKLVLKCPDGFQAKRLGKRHSVRHLINQWHKVRRPTVFDILMSAVFTDAQFLSCLLDPNIEEYCVTIFYAQSLSLK